ncbi:MAG TPA: hypothetical protein PKB10_11690 [Tepidisphaeraceae bacterium]|nr:hypothetical protein [Tepidisphaeraceae bacterium]
MTLRGRVENGVIKLLEGPIPAEGTEVSVRVEQLVPPLPTPSPLPRGARMEDILAMKLEWQGEEQELAALEKMIRDEREADLARSGG